MRVHYVSMDGIVAGVGASQVLPYVSGLAARGVEMHLCTFEQQDPTREMLAAISDQGVHWDPQPFGGRGAKGGAFRIARAARWLRGARFVHARSDLSAAAAMTAHVPRFIWDVRSLWADQRIALGSLHAGSPESAVLRRIERAAARKAHRIVTLTESVLDVLEQRHGFPIRERAVVIPTCVDLRHFTPTLMPTGPIRLALSGSLNAYYDLPAMLALARSVIERHDGQLIAFVPPDSAWEDELADVDERRHLSYGQMPTALASCHVGLSVCRQDAGISLRAAMPTKLAEFLASGRPVVVNRGLGDMDAIVARYRCGVILDSIEADDIERTANEVVALVADPETPSRCRAAAEGHFSLQTGVDKLLQLYRAADA